MFQLVLLAWQPIFAGPGCSWAALVGNLVRWLVLYWNFEGLVGGYVNGPWGPDCQNVHVLVPRSGKRLQKIWNWLATNFRSPAYGRHRLSRRVRIVSPILWNPAFLTFFYTFGHFFLIFWPFFYFSGTFWHYVLTKNHVSCVTSHMSCVICHMSHVTCHLPPVPNTNSHRPFPADFLIIHSRLVPDKKKKP